MRMSDPQVGAVAPNRPSGRPEGRWGQRPLPFLLMALCCALQMTAAMRVTALKCEYATDPLGVDVAAPRLFWQVASNERGQRQTAWQVRAASTAAQLAAGDADLWDSGKIDGDDTTGLHYAGKPLHSSQQVFWQARAWDAGGQPSAWSEPATWTMGLLPSSSANADASEWQGAWIGAAAKSENLLLRREFVVKPGLRRAVIHVCGLGQYELFFNGTKTGADLLSPGWTNYNRTTLYDTHEVTAQLRVGRNAIGLALGPGMYRVERPPGRFAKFVHSFGELRAIAQLRLEYADGAVEFVVTDSNWRTYDGPLTFSSIYGGEDYDARRLPAGWDRANFDDHRWAMAVKVDRPTDTLRGETRAAEPLRAIETRAPVSVRSLPGNVVLFDFGQNTSFMPQLGVSGPAGSTVRLVPGEVVDASGNIERGTMGGAHRGSAWWQYTKATDGAESWFPQFYYVGSRYVRAELIPARPGAPLPKIDKLEMVIVHSSAEPVGHFSTSNERLNRIRDLVRWAQCSNMVSILTDCPHREKLGWLEQYHLNGPSIRYEFDVDRIYAKGMWDMAEAQTPEGLIPNIAPEYTVFKGAFRAAAEWGAAFILVPWQQYEFTGDAQPLREHYAAMKHYFSHLETRAKNDILSDGLGDWYDYEPGKGKRANLTPPPITATAFFYEDAHTLAQIAGVLGEREDVIHFTQRAGQIRQRYIAEFRQPGTGLYGTGSQASLAIPLAMGLIEPADHAAVVAALVRDVEQKGYASAGDIGFRYLLRALAGAGRSDAILRLIDQDEKPGYGYQLKKGATALAESWEASLGASQDHFMLGQIIEWFYADLAGIAPDPAGAGFKKIIIRPQPVGDLAWVEAGYRSIHGPIEVKWHREHGEFRLDVAIPANTTATVFVPAKQTGVVRESGEPVANVADVEFLRREGDRDVFKVASGSYHFESEW